MTAPSATLAKVASFAGIPASGADLGFLGTDGSTSWAELGAAHTASGNPMRFATGRIPIRMDDRWRAAMPSAQRRRSPP